MIPSSIAFIGSMLARYKQVRDDITESDPVLTGIVSGSPEIHEKISATTGRGAVVIFATERENIPIHYESPSSGGALDQRRRHGCKRHRWPREDRSNVREAGSENTFLWRPLETEVLAVRRHRCGLDNVGRPTFAVWRTWDEKVGAQSWAKPPLLLLP